MTQVIAGGGIGVTVLVLICMALGCLTAAPAPMMPNPNEVWAAAATTMLELEVMEIITVDQSHGLLRHAEAEEVRACTENPLLPQFQIVLKSSKRINACINGDLVGLRPIVQDGGAVDRWREVTAYYKTKLLGLQGLLEFVGAQGATLIVRSWDAAKGQFVDFVRWDAGVKYWYQFNPGTWSFEWVVVNFGK